MFLKTSDSITKKIYTYIYNNCSLFIILVQAKLNKWRNAPGLLFEVKQYKRFKFASTNVHLPQL